jgi:hypothetical protein
MIDMISAVVFGINIFFIRTQQSNLEAKCQHIIGTPTERRYIMGTSVIEENPIVRGFLRVVVPYCILSLDLRVGSVLKLQAPVCIAVPHSFLPSLRINQPLLFDNECSNGPQGCLQGGPTPGQNTDTSNNQISFYSRDHWP